MRKEKTIKRGLLYRVYTYGDGVYFLEDGTKPRGVPTWGYSTWQGVLEAIRYNDLETEFDAEINKEV